MLSYRNSLVVLGLVLLLFGYTLPAAHLYPNTNNRCYYAKIGISEVSVDERSTNAQKEIKQRTE